MFVDEKNKILFRRIGFILLIINIVNYSYIKINKELNIFFIVFINLIFSILIVLVIYNYIKENNKILTEATDDIKNCIFKNKNFKLESNKEGEIYRLFHEINVLVTTLDTHALKEQEAKEALRNVILDISHQIKTPLAALNIYNGIIQQEIEEESDIYEFTKLSEKELDRIELLIKNLLTMVKFDTDTIVLNKKNENLFSILKEINDSFIYRLKSEKKELTITGQNDLKIYCDRSWFKESISNLVKNSLDYTDIGGKIIIEYKKIASIVQIKIIDNGRGISDEDINYIFKRFFRSKISNDKMGVGLGLALSKSIINKHNGTIEIKSELDKGSVFIINLVIPTKL